MRLYKDGLRDQIADLLTDRMERKKITRQNLIKRSGLSPATASQICAGERDVKVGTLIDLLTAVGLQLKVEPITR